MAELRTRETDASIEEFLAGVPDEARRQDFRALLGTMREVTGGEPRMCGPGMVGFGRYHYRYASGHVGDSFLAGFSPRKKDLTVYVTSGLDRHAELPERLGRHSTGKSCLYLKRLPDADPAVLRERVSRSVAYMRKTYGA